MKTTKSRYLTRAIGILTAFLAANAVADKYKANNTLFLNQPASWTSNAVPGSSEFGVWDATVAALNTTNALGADLIVGGIKILNPGGPVLLTGSNTLTLNGVSGAGIDLSSASQDLTVNCPLTVASNQDWTIGGGRTLKVDKVIVYSPMRIGGAGQTRVNEMQTMGVYPAEYTGSSRNEVGPVSGPGSVVKSGSGTLLFSGNNSYTGTTTVSNGTLQLLSTSSNTVAGVCSALGTNTLSLVGPGAQVQVHLVANTNVTFAGGGQPNLYGNVTIAVGSLSAGVSNQTVSLGAPALVCSGASNNVTFAGSTNGYTLDVGVFKTHGGPVTLRTLGVDVHVAGISSNGVYPAEFVGSSYGYPSEVEWNFGDQCGSIVDVASFTKSGPKRLTLTGTNSYSGATMIRDGPLVLNGALLGGGTVTVTGGGTLGGTGTISGPVSIGSGGTFSVSSFFDIYTEITWDGMTINNTLSLGGTALMRLNRTNSPNCDRVTGISTVTYGGTLVVTNVGPALQAGDSFKLFDATNYTGSFAAISPATPGIGITWDTSLLAVSGTLRVVSATPSAAKDILTFSFGALGSATISGTNISLAVPCGTNVTALAPTYTVSPFATGAPASGSVQNFTTPQTYTVTAEDSSTKAYTVTVTVVDTTPPLVLSVSADCTSNKVCLTFSEPVSLASATTAANYAIDNGLVVLSALLGPPNTVCLFTSPLTFGVTYTLTINGVRDLCSNAIAPNSQIPFSCPTNPCLFFAGLQHCPLGNASLTVASNKLIVSNIGASGVDGCRVELPANAAGWEAQFEPLDPTNALPVGGYLREQLVGTGGSGANGVLATTTLTKLDGTNWGMKADFSPLGSNLQRVVISSNGVVVHRSPVSDRQEVRWASTVLGWGPSGPLSLQCKPQVWDPFSYLFYLNWGLTNFYKPSSITVFTEGTNAGTWLGNEVIFEPVSSSVTNATATAMRLTSGGLSGFTITDESVAVAYDGLLNWSLGNATLNVASNKLIVSNIGASGVDGCRVELPANAAGWEAQFEPLDPTNALLVGSYLREQLVGTGGSGANGELATTTLTKLDGTNWMMKADFSPLGPNLQRVVISSNGVVVHRSPVSDRQEVRWASTVLGWGPSGPPLTLKNVLLEPLNWDPLKDIRFCWRFGLTNYYIPSIAVFTDGTNTGTWGGDEVFFESVSITNTSATVSDIRLTSGGMSNFTIKNETVAVRYGGLLNWSLGNASLSLQSNQLTVANLGSSGQDGVSIALNEAQGFEAHWQDLDPNGTMPVGAYLQGQVFGTAGTLTNGLLGWMQMTKAGPSNFVATADFSSLGATTCTLDAYDGTNLVSHVPGISLTAILWTSEVSQPPWRDIHRTGPKTNQWCYTLVEKTPLRLAGGSTVLADMVVVTPEGVPLISSLSAVKLLASGIPQITITSESVTTLPVMVQQPPSLTVTEGSLVTLAVTASGTPPLTYQWLFNDAPILGATNSSYTVTNATPATDGTYRVIVSNAVGSVASDPAVLTISKGGPCEYIWYKLAPNHSPSRRDKVEMVFDSHRNRTLLYGGLGRYSGSPYWYDDTWEWNGNDWTRVCADKPWPGWGFWPNQMAYDTKRGRAIIFTYYIVDKSSETWEWDGDTATWTKVTTVGTPPARYNAGMVYDSANDRVVLFGGFPHGVGNGTWEYDPASQTWANVTPVGPSPQAQGNVAMAFDSGRGKVVFFSWESGETWEWDGMTKTWSRVTISGSSPPQRFCYGIVYNSKCHRIVMYGGSQGFGGPYLDDLWIYDGVAKTWTKVSAHAPPGCRFGHGMVYDSHRDTFVVFGGGGYPWYTDETLLGDTWEWRLPPLTLPAPVICGWSHVPDGFHFAFGTTPGPTYVVEFKSSLSDPGWTVLKIVAGDGEDCYFIDNAPLPVTRFYRVRVSNP